jgi:DNA-binding transcriptional LysR family regulator
MENLTFDWNDLKFFLAVARRGGLSGAADALGTSPSTVSRHIDALEQRLGSTLFLRQQTGYLLTDDGSELLEHVAGVEQSMIAAERKGSLSARQEVSGQVRLATTELLANHLIVPNLHAFRERYPKLQVEISISMIRANLSRREADLALRLVDPTKDADAADYVAAKIGKLDFGLYGARGMLTNQTLSGGETWQALDYVTWSESWAELATAKWLRAAMHTRRPAIACNSFGVQYAAMRAGLGIGLLPRFLGDGDAALQRINHARPELTHDLWLVYHRDLKASQRVIAMRDFVTDLIQSNLGI